MNTSTAVDPSELTLKESSARFSFDWKAYRGVLALMGTVVLLAFLTQGTFLSPRNLTNLTRQVAINGILAVGMTYVILIGGIDLSVGSVVALSGVIAGVFQVNLGLAQWPHAGIATGITILAALSVGLSCGVFNGWMITRYKIAPFIITLGMMVIARGFALITANGAAISPLSDQFNFLGQGYLSPLVSASVVGIVGALLSLVVFLKKAKKVSDYITLVSIAAISGGAVWVFQSYRGVPIPVLIFGTLGALGVLVLQKTRLGRFILAMGGNPEAAWLAGVPIQKISFGIYAAIGALSGLCGVILSARLNGALPTAGELFELDAIAAVVIGGTSLMGGVGSVKGSIFGAFFIGVLNNGMSLLDVTEFYQKIIKGVIIILAVWIDVNQSSSRR